MIRKIAVCLALALGPGSGAFAVDDNAVSGRAVGDAAAAAATTEDQQEPSSGARRVVEAAHTSESEQVYAELPPPPRIIAVGSTHYKRITPRRAGNWKTQQYE